MKKLRKRKIKFKSSLTLSCLFSGEALLLLEQCSDTENREQLEGSSGKHHWIAFSKNKADHDSSSRITWSRKAKLAKLGRFFAHLTAMKRSLALVSYTVSCVWPYSDGLTKLGTMMFFPLSPFSFSSSFVVTSISMESSVDGAEEEDECGGRRKVSQRRRVSEYSISLMKFSKVFEEERRKRGLNYRRFRLDCSAMRSQPTMIFEYCWFLRLGKAKE
jgi:hypothetical protein